MNPLRFIATAMMTCCSVGIAETNSEGEGFLSQVDQVAPGLVDDRAMLDFFDQPRNPIGPANPFVFVGQNRPGRWILEVIKIDLESGVVGALNDLSPGIRSADIFHTNRRVGLEDVSEMRDLVLTGEPWETTIMWWSFT